MSKELVRFGVAMEGALLEELDQLVAERGSTRSEIIRDLVRGELARAKVRAGAAAVGSLTLVYDHHVRDLSDKLTEMQHQLGDRVRATMHIHLDHDHCLEVVVMQGRSDELRAASDKILATRGVTHGGLELVATTAQLHAHGHGHAHDHAHAHEPAKRGRASGAKKSAAKKTRR